MNRGYRERDSATSVVPTTNLVEVRGLVRHFNGVRAVDGIDFTFGGGQVHGFIGPNGAGKTTTMRILATLDDPTEGEVLFNGRSVIDYPDEFRRHMGFMPDYLDAYPDMVVAEYLDFYGRVHELGPTKRKGRLDEIINFTTLGEILERPVTALSKGQKQRLSLARVLVNNPAVLIMDEPAAGLDPRARVQLRDLTRALADQGKAVFISSHILTELSEICDAVTIIEAGRLCASTSVRALQKQVDAGHRIAVTLHRPTDEQREALVRFLLETPGVVRAETSKGGATFAYEGEVPARAEVLKRLIAHDFVVTEFFSATSDLEDAFLSLTKGKVT